MNHFAFILLLAAAAQVKPGKEDPVLPTLTLPARVEGDPGDFVQVKAETNGKEVRWFAVDTNLKVFPTQLLKDSKTAVVICSTPGSYGLIAYTALGDLPSDPARTTIIIRGPPAPPTPPVPPGPTPVPPGPAPINAPGFRVLVLFDDVAREKLTPGQNAIIFGEDVNKYLHSKCAIDVENKNGAFRIWPHDVNAERESQPWRDALKRPRASVPWMILSNSPGGGYEGPLPVTPQEFLDMCKKVGG